MLGRAPVLGRLATGVEGRLTDGEARLTEGERLTDGLGRLTLRHHRRRHRARAASATTRHDLHLHRGPQVSRGDETY